MATKRNKKRQTETIILPLTPYDLTVTTFFGTQQMFTNLADTVDPSVLIKDLSETLMVDKTVLESLPIGSWDDDILEVLSERYFAESADKSDTGLLVPDIETNIMPNTSQQIELDNPVISLLGIARHLSDLVEQLGLVAKNTLEAQKQYKTGNAAKDSVINALNNTLKKPLSKSEQYIQTKKARGLKNQRSRTVDKKNTKLQTKKQRGLYELLPKCLWFIHKGTKYYLLGREADALLGKIPHSKLTAAEYITCKEIERGANDQKPERDPKTGDVLVDPVLKNKAGKPTGKVLSQSEIRQQKQALLLQDIDIAFNLTINQIAALLRRADETLPLEIAEREYFLTERAKDFQDLPAWVAFAIRGFFLERFLLLHPIHAGGLI